MLDTVKINHVQHISFTQSRLTDAVSVILSELLSYEHPAKPLGPFPVSGGASSLPPCVARPLRCGSHLCVPQWQRALLLEDPALKPGGPKDCRSGRRCRWPGLLPKNTETKKSPPRGSLRCSGDDYTWVCFLFLEALSGRCFRHFQRIFREWLPQRDPRLPYSAGRKF